MGKILLIIDNDKHKSLKYLAKINYRSLAKELDFIINSYLEDNKIKLDKEVKEDNYFIPNNKFEEDNCFLQNSDNVELETNSKYFKEDKQYEDYIDENKYF